MWPSRNMKWVSPLCSLPNLTFDGSSGPAAMPALVPAKIVRGESPAMEAVLVTRTGPTEFSESSLFETDLPYLQHAVPPKRFVL